MGTTAPGIVWVGVVGARGARIGGSSCASCILRIVHAIQIEHRFGRHPGRNGHVEQLVSTPPRNGDGPCLDSTWSRLVLSTPFAIAVGVLQALHGPVASVIVGLAALAAIWPLSCWLVNRAEDRGESPDGPQAIQGTGNTPPATDSTEAESEWRWQEAVKGRDFG